MQAITVPTYHLPWKKKRIPFPGRIGHPWEGREKRGVVPVYPPHTFWMFLTCDLGSQPLQDTGSLYPRVLLQTLHSYTYLHQFFPNSHLYHFTSHFPTLPEPFPGILFFSHYHPVLVEETEPQVVALPSAVFYGLNILFETVFDSRWFLYLCMNCS